ncbi:unnamed protein product [Rotaria sp. Silwood1]|nr:unnamed protein product [Rotaria sp. Silwood1]CAF1074107.1 unnamed protein product [Rotaria sp. Silwood1]CAF1080917.1 unnamed protein product [Rotaria sp. Silwood1]CAF3412627.1 unnamed protein product [Rotaria sp. Silwood1]CAF3438470.1 unnamed protein product [Rotaria sp. Silwood1]
MENKKKLTSEKNRKLVVVGDGMCGKTCLLYAFVYDTFDPDHVPTIFDTYATTIQIDDERITLALFDTAGQEDYDILRPLSYNDTNIVLICFSINHPVSARNVIEKWNPEVRHFCRLCPIILVGCKKDLRIDPQIISKLKQDSEKQVTTDVGRQIAAQIKADAYMECSAKTREGIQELFVHAARLSLKKSNRKKHSKCALY